ncbi:MAG: Pentachlorophenol 4-monooxygenase [Chlamydiae bacterium]|nr:Pentachlorophenol 4-monooxygenase [Chlamydiota bacterium]
MDHPVLIVGAGPTGLTLAITLRRYGIPVRVVDLKTTAHHESRSLAIHSRTLEVFDDLGILDQALEKGTKVTKINLHFNKKKRATLDFGVLKAPNAFILSLPQNETEHLLIDKLHEYDVRVDRSVKLTALKPHQDYVEATLVHNEEQKEIIRASWVIGCDGVHSSVRRYMAGDFIGYEYPMHFSLADVYMDTSLSLNEMNSFIGNDGAQFILPIKEKLYRIISQRKEKDLEKPTTVERLEEMINSRSSTLFDILDVEWIKDFKISHRISSVFRKGRLFIAGDAAHVHSPVGGQGMNMGIQDAHNLGWKLAYVIKHKANTKLLASYSRERIPVAKQTLHETEKLTKIMTSCKQASINYYARVLQWINKVSIFHAMIVYQFSGIAVRYKKSPIIQPPSRFLSFIPAIKAGCRFFDGEITSLEDQSASNTFDLTRGTKHNLFIFFREGRCREAVLVKKDLEKKYSDLLKIHLISNSLEISESNAWLDVGGLNAAPYKIGKTFMVMVRPDGYIGVISKKIKTKKIESYFHDLIGINQIE